MDVPDGANAPCWSPKIGQLIEQAPNCGLRDNTKYHRFVSHKADYDAENRFELFLLDDGQSKVEYKEETRKSPPAPAYDPLHVLTPPQQASPTRPSSPSTKKTTRSAT
jgi:hypothetical protein